MKNLDFFKIRKEPNIKQINGVPLKIVSKYTQDFKDRDVLLEKLLRNKGQSGLVINGDDSRKQEVDEEKTNELDENTKYDDIEPVTYITPITEKPKKNIRFIDEKPIENIDEEQHEILLPPAPPSQPKKTKKRIVIIDKPGEQTEPPNPTVAELPKPIAIKTPRKKRIVIIDKSNRPTINLQKDIVNRLPAPKKTKTVILKTSRFYLNNRKLFLKNFDDIFKKYKKEIEQAESENVSCDSRNESRELFVHQKIVKDYLNLHTPYRGLLLYHGLGSGKTCTSIAIAEGMKIPDKRIFVMTPASLKMNYFSELKKCGDDLYKKKQYWDFVSVEGQPEYLEILSNALSLPADYISRNGGAWLVNVKKPANFESLNGEQQKQIDEQLNRMIRTKYTDINYNGLNIEKMRQLTRDYTINPFDNSVVIVDEAHNFVSRIVNSLKKKGKRGERGEPGTTTPPKSISISLYQYLMEATNVRIVFLSGTPIINYPNEIAVLYNILRGYIKTWTFQLTVGEEVRDRINKDSILDFFERSRFRTFDYVEYSGNKLTVTRNPFGFINSMKLPAAAKTKKVTAAKAPTEAAARKTKKVLIVPAEEAAQIGGGVAEDYDGVFLDDGSAEGDESLDGQGNISDEVFQRTIVNILSKNGVYVAPNGISIVNHKCLPDNEDDFFTTFVNIPETKMMNEDVFKRRILGLTSYFRSSQEKLLPRFIPSERIVERDGKQTTESSVFHMIYCPMSKFQFKQYISIREKEILQEKNLNKQKTINEKKGVFIENSTYRIYSRAVCNFAFPQPPGRPVPLSKIEAELHENDENEYRTMKDVPEEDEGLNDEADAEDIDTKGMTERIKKDYLYQIQQALKEINRPEYLQQDALAEYSPKFAEFLRIFGTGVEGAEEGSEIDHKGCHLLYSNFRTIEGIGILRLALQINGYQEFKIRKSAATTGEWEIVPGGGEEGSFSNSGTYKRFVLYTGTETAEEKEIIRNIYNGDWDIVPSSISSVLRGAGYTNNMFGEVIRLFMITASGSEGINLRNTRFVHIIEPYWNLTRVEQIIGRASRICSHASLPEEFRTVKVYMYISVFSHEKDIDGETVGAALGEKKSQIDIINEDYILSSKEISKLDPTVKLTTDESLLEISTIKNRINTQILRAVKETAVDCRLYQKAHSAEGLRCYDGYGIVKSNSFGSFPSIQQDIGERMEQNVEKVQTKLMKVTIKGKAYKMNMATNEVYEEEGEGDDKELRLVGVLVKEKDKGKKMEYRLVTK